MAKPWNQLPRLKRLVEERKLAVPGTTNRMIADELGYAPNYFQAILDGTRPAGQKFKERVAEVFQIDVFELMDNKAAKRANGLNLSGFNNIDIFQIEEMIHGLGDKSLTEDERHIVIEAAKDFVERQKLIIFKMKGQKN